jgi:hypothetical protein
MENQTDNDSPAQPHEPGQVIGPSQSAPPVSPTSPVPPETDNMATGDRPAAMTVQSPAAGVMANGQIVSVNQEQASQPKNRFHPSKKLLGLLIAALVLLGGTAAAYLGYVVPNKPGNVLAKSLANRLKAHQFTTEGTFNITSDCLSSKVEYKSAVNEDSHSTDTTLNATVSGVSFPVEVISANNNVYFKIGDLSSLAGVINSFVGSDPSVKQFETSFIKNFTNQWISVDSTLIKEVKLDCLTSLPAAVSQADINSLQNSYKNSSFATITSHGADTVDGKAALKYQLSINDDKLSAFDLDSTPYVKSINSCLSKAGGTGLSLSSTKDGDTAPLTLWVDKSSKQVIKYATQSTNKDKAKGIQGDLTGTITYAPVSITPPANAKPLLSLLNKLNLGPLLPGNLDFNPSVETGAAKDTERQTDINALQSQLEVYFADNGFYPTLAQLNSAAWRAANLKGADINAFKDPDGSAAALASSPTKNIYAYQAAPAGCNDTTIKCQHYTLTATLSTGKTYVKQSLN